MARVSLQARPSASDLGQKRAGDEARASRQIQPVAADTTKNGSVAHVALEMLNMFYLAHVNNLLENKEVPPKHEGDQPLF